MKKLPRSFYLRPTLSVARDLLGKSFVRKTPRGLLVGTIVEVEAYRHDDPASHSYRGKTERNKVMYHKGGHLYVYFTYGMHHCANIVTGKEGTGEAVLIRAVEPLRGIGVMEQNRRFSRKRMKVQDLTRGPARVCQAFGLTIKQNGTDLLGDEVFVTAGEMPPRFRIQSSARIGITNGANKQWRFFIKDNPFVSKQRPHKQ